MSETSVVKPKLNPTWLIATLGIVALLVPSALYWHARQMRVIGTAMLQRAEQLETESKWSDAAEYYDRYLKIHPDDYEVRIRLAESYSKSADSPKRIARAIELYYRAVGLAPTRLDLRIQLAELLLAMERYSAARDQADAALAVDPQYEPAHSVRVFALYRLSQAGQLPMEETLREMQRVSKDQPKNITLAEALAHALRKQSIPRFDAMARERLADEVMDRMVQADPGNAQVYFARFHYRMRYQLDGAEADLTQVARLAPEEFETLVATAEYAMHQDRLEEAAVLYERLTKLSPTYAPAYLGLAESYARRGEIEEAIRIWSLGLSIEPESILFNLRLAEAWMAGEQWEEAKQALDTLDRLTSRLAADQPSAASRYWRDAADFMNARWEFAQGKSGAAKERLLPIAGNVTKDALPAAIALSRQAHLLLAEIYRSRDENDLEVQSYEHVFMHDPTDVSARLALAQALYRAGRFAEAIDHCRPICANGSAPREAWILCAQLEYLKQMHRKVGERDWTQLEQTLSNATQHVSSDWRLELLRADMQIARQTDGEAHQDAGQLLQSVESRFPGEADLFEKLATRYDRIDRPQDADRVVAHLLELTGDATRVALIQAKSLVRRDQLAGAKRVLQAGLTEASGPAKREIGLALSDLLRREGKLAEAKRLLQELLSDDQSDIALYRRLAEIALQMSDFAAAQHWEDAVRRVEGPHGTHWQLLKALRLIATTAVNEPMFQQAKQIEARLSSRRPDWSEVQILKGLLADREGRWDTAMEAYQKAVALGGRSAFVFDRLARLFYVERRFAAADQAITELARLEPLSPEMLDLQIGIKLALGHDLEYVHRQLRLLAAQPDASADRAIMLLEFLLRQDNSTNSDEWLDADEPLLVAAIETHPENVTLLFLAGSLRLSQERTEEAIAALRRVIALDPGHLLALNNLAAILAERHEYQEALQLINRALKLSEGNVPLVLDTKATVLLHLGRPQEAADLLKRIVQADGGRDPRFLFHLAMAHEQLGSLQQARDALAAAQRLDLTNRFLSRPELDKLDQLTARLSEASIKSQ